MGAAGLVCKQFQACLNEKQVDLWGECILGRALQSLALQQWAASGGQVSRRNQMMGIVRDSHMHVRMACKDAVLWCVACTRLRY
jgi:hypothetical protein